MLRVYTIIRNPRVLNYPRCRRQYSICHKMFHIENQENYFVDPFGNFDIKIIATVSYILALPGCCVAFCFVWYEASGSAGPYMSLYYLYYLYQSIGLKAVFSCKFQLCIHQFSGSNQSLEWTLARIDLHTYASDKTWYRHDGFFTIDSFVSDENLDCLYPEICTYYG